MVRRSRPSSTSITQRRSRSETTVASSCPRRWWASSSDNRRGAVDVAGLELVRSIGERARDLIAAGALLVRHLGVRGAADDALGQPRPETPGHPLTRGQLLMGLG